MPRLWLAFGLIYVLVTIAIFIDHYLRFDATWQWSEGLHHEAFFIATAWVATAYLFVAAVEYIRYKVKSKSRTMNVENRMLDDKDIV